MNNGMIATTPLPTQPLLCCDWGTSSFRLQLMDTATYRCIGEIQSATGVAATFEHWKAVGADMDRGEFFRRQLSQQIELLAAKLSSSLSHLPVVISGMASSSIGMQEVPYATLPFAVDGSRASVRYFETQPGVAQPDFPHDLLLISGVSSEDDVMRGEETQLVGLIALLDLSGAELTNAIYIFPGTHSKHLCVENRELVRFDTYMTGELFDLMARQSILNDSVDLTNLSDCTDANIQAFRHGVKQSKSSVILNGLFRIRTNQLLHKSTKTENAFFLSGLLIGSELNYLVKQENWPLVLCSGRNLAAFYELAINELNLNNRTMNTPAQLVDRAASVGQICLFQNQLVKQAAE